MPHSALRAPQSALDTPHSAVQLTVDDAAGIEGVTPSAILKRVERLRIPVEWAESEAGQRAMLIPLDALSPAGQARYLATQYQSDPDDPHVFKPKGQRAWQVANAIVAGDPRAARKFADNADLVMRAIEARNAAQLDDRSVTQTMKQFARANDVGVGTLYRKIKDYEDRGPEALLDLRGKHASHSRLAEWQRNHIEQRYLDPTRQTPIEVYESLAEECAARGEPRPSYSAVKRYVRNRIPDAQKVYFREGPRAFKNKITPYIPRDYSELEYYAWVCGDCRTWDMRVCAPEGKPVRPVIAMWEDLASRQVIGYAAVPRASDASVIGLSFTRVVRGGLAPHSAGIPENVYIDNGKDFNAGQNRGKKLYATQLQLGLWAALGCRVVNAWPFNPQSKPIESLFNTLTKRMEHNYPGWTGRDAKDKPEKLKREERNEELLTWPEFIAALEQTINWYNAEHVHSALGCTPNDRAAQLAADYRPALPTEHALDLMLKRRPEVTCRQSGLVIEGVRFWHDALAGRAKEQFMVFYDPADMTAVQVYTTGRQPQFVCTAAADADAAWGLDEQTARKIQRRKRLARERVKGFEKEFQIAHDSRAAIQAMLEEQERFAADQGDAPQSAIPNPQSSIRPTDYDRIPEAQCPGTTATQEEAKKLLERFRNANREQIGPQAEEVS